MVESQPHCFFSAHPTLPACTSPLTTHPLATYSLSSSPLLSHACILSHSSFCVRFLTLRSIRCREFLLSLVSRVLINFYSGKLGRAITCRRPTEDSSDPEHRLPRKRQDGEVEAMAPILLPRVLSGQQLRQVSRSISTTLSSIPPSIEDRDIPEDIYASIHQNMPLIPRAIQHISNLVSRASTPINTSILLSKRQNQILAIPTTYAGLNEGPQPGAVAGIVIGSVAGFLLILWLLYTCFGGGFGGGRTEVVEEEIVRRHSRSPRRSHSHSETIEIKSRSRSPPPRRERERIIVEETRRVSRPPPEPEPEPEPIDDIVEVIEEHSVSDDRPPPSRKTSKRQSGYRTVDPAEFGGGGGRSMRRVR